MTKSDPPLISVCMPVYNAERFVAEAVESILDQTLGDFEFLIIDDGSTDGSRRILEAYAARDPRIHLISRPNTGYAVALNEMLGQARGDLLARMDADDVALPDRLERQVDYLEAHLECVCVGSWVLCTDSKGRPVSIGFRGPDDDATLQGAALSGSCPLCHPGVMMRTDALRSVGGYREDFMPAEDLDLFLRLGERGRLGNIQEPLLKYRMHDQSISVQRNSHQVHCCQRASDEACARRGLPSQYVPPCRPWRPVDRDSLWQFHLDFGWAGFAQGDRGMAIEYGLKAIRVIPWREGGWRLLACALLKRPRPAVPLFPPLRVASEDRPGPPGVSCSYQGRTP